MPKKVIQDQDKYVLRLPDGMRERIRLAADENNRSMNAEIVDRLEESFDWIRKKALHSAEINDLNNEKERLYQELDDYKDKAAIHEQARIESLAEIKSLRLKLREVDEDAARRQAEIANLRQELGEVHQILRNYVAHSEHLRKLEEHVRVLSAHLPAASRDDALKQMRRERKDEE
jgi:chromosome segregation ATPase